MFWYETLLHYSITHILSRIISLFIYFFQEKDRSAVYDEKIHR